MKYLILRYLLLKSSDMKYFILRYLLLKSSGWWR